jgi:hypothetical protein
VAALALSAVFSWKQFHGIPSEWTLQQAQLGRQISRGEGFTTEVNYPQTYAVLKARGHPFSDKQPYPELYHAPLYALILAAMFAVLPDSIWEHVPEPPGGWAPDYLVLALNLAFFWFAMWLVWRLGKKLFDDRVALVGAVGSIVSVSLWQQTAVVSGLPIMIVLLVGAFHLLADIEQDLHEFPVLSRAVALRLAALGLLAGLMFLFEYSAGLVFATVLAWLAWRVRGAARWPALGIYAAVAVLTATPWLVRNVMVVGNPVGLAWQNVELKYGDPTAEPAAQRNTATTGSPGLNIKKLGNKGLTGLELNLKERIWSGGGMLLTAFFIAGLAYQFRHGPANRLRWCFAALLLVLLSVQPFLGSGESPRLPAYYLAPLVMVFGAAFFFVLVDSQAALSTHWRWAVAGLLALQALPLVRDCMEPRKVHFHYPPYFPNLFMELGRDVKTRYVEGAGIAADVPAGTAWYGQVRVWAKPERLRDLYEIGVQQHVAALLLTPVTLDKPFFTELAARRERTIRLSDSGGWGVVYAGLVTREMPKNFPLPVPQTLTENMVLLYDPTAFRRR